MTDRTHGRRYRLLHRFADTAYFKNPVLLMLGIAPLVIFSSTLKDGLLMSVSLSVMLIVSNALISLLHRVVPQKFRLLIYSSLNAFIVLLIYCLLSAFAPSVAHALYAAVPFLICNSIFLYRAEAYASQRGVLSSMYDGVCVGAGFIALTVIVSALRELAGLGTLWGVRVIQPRWALDFASTPAGGFIIIGCVIAAVNFINDKFGKGGRSL